MLSHRNLPLLLLQAREAVLAHFRPILNHFGLTEQQWRVIRALAEAGPMEPNRIAETCQILGPSLAGVLARMEELGLVARRRLEADQRRVRVSLTAKSRALFAHVAPLVEAQYRELESAVGKQAIAQAYRTLDRLIAQFGAPVAAVALPKSPPRAGARRRRATRR
ncbi:MAG: homoprotocatechuate degradation operon regulator HpaR [Burkholderiales bacterium]|nr:homoprotocatechuate degradation operon regulator HpaR [Burkholderiales bacterium]